MRAWILLFPAVLAGQYSPFDLIPLPAGETAATVEIKLTPPPQANERVQALPLTDAEGKYLSPQPAMKATVTGDVLRLELTGVHRWGRSRLQVETGRRRDTYWLQRGPEVSPTALTAEPGRTHHIWLYNHQTAHVPVRWRIVSGEAAICGDGPKPECADEASWGLLQLAPAASRAVGFTVPNRWFSTLEGTRGAQLELRFGDSEQAPVLSVPLRFRLQTQLFQLPAVWEQHFLWRLFETVLWVTVGAAILMLAQVVIPGFRRCLSLESQLDSLQDRYNAIGSRVGTRLHSRCNRELRSVRSGLLMKVPGQWLPRRLLRRLALFANATELARLTAMVTAIETRLRLTERLDELRLELQGDANLFLPLSLQWKRFELVRTVESILGRQFMVESDARAAAATLDAATALENLRKDFHTELEARIERVREEWKCAPWQTEIDSYRNRFPTAMRLLTADCGKSDSGWSDEALVQRDLDSIRLGLLYELISCRASPHATPDRVRAIEDLLTTASLPTINQALNLIRQIKEGVFESDIQQALLEERCAIWFEPDTPSDQDVLSVSLRFNEESLNRSAARENFQCYWHTDVNGEAPAAWNTEGRSGERYELGWDIQMVPPRGHVTLSPVVMHEGAKVEKGEEESPEATVRSVRFTVEGREGRATAVRIARGFVDAVLTAVVPVITVAVTQAQTDSTLDWRTLISLGFTSQAIRAALVPESVAPPPKP